MKPKSLTGKEFAAFKFAPIVRRDGRGNIDFYNAQHESWSFWISERDVVSRRNLLSMILHLSGKNWITAEHIRELILIAGEIVCRNPYTNESLEK